MENQFATWADVGRLIDKGEHLLKLLDEYDIILKPKKRKSKSEGRQYLHDKAVKK